MQFSNSIGIIVLFLAFIGLIFACMYLLWKKINKPHVDMISTQAKYSAMLLGMKLEGMYKGRKVCVLNRKGPYIYMIPNKDLLKEKFIVLSMSDFKKPTENTKLRGNKLIYGFPSHRQMVWNKTRDEWMIIFDELAQASNLVEQGKV